jgi:adenylosuccinate synthase
LCGPVFLPFQAAKLTAELNHPMHTAVAGLAWGDEGKGKVVDVLCPAFDVVVRYNGGANAGHTVKFNNESFALHLLPTGVLHANMSAVIGPGVALDPVGIIEEIDTLSSRGIRIGDRLKISDRAHLVLDYHKMEDRLSEEAGGGVHRIGTTSRGIGPCYADKMRRTSAIRMCDLLHPDVLRAKVERFSAAKSHMLSAT